MTTTAEAAVWPIRKMFSILLSDVLAGLPDKFAESIKDGVDTYCDTSAYKFSSLKAISREMLLSAIEDAADAASDDLTLASVEGQLTPVQIAYLHDLSDLAETLLKRVENLPPAVMILSED